MPEFDETSAIFCQLGSHRITQVHWVITSKENSSKRESKRLFVAVSLNDWFDLSFL